MGYNLFDIKSPFYQDICIPYSSIDGTDVLLTDRINYYYNNEETVCQSNCKFSDYLMESQYMKCNCDISNSEIDTKKIMKFKAKTIYQTFYSALKYSNYKVLNCYKLILTFNIFTKNIGSILSIIYFLIFIIFFIIYISKGIKLFEATISIAFNKNFQMDNLNKKKIKKHKIFKKKE